MLKLDFSFFSLNEEDKRGLVYQKFWLDRLTPRFFSPRLEKLLYLPLLDKKGCSLRLGLGRQNFKDLSPLKKQETIAKAVNIISQYKLDILGVDRRFKDDMQILSNNFNLTFGDNFIKALALVMTERFLSDKEIDRLVLIGRLEGWSELLEEFLKYGFPLSLQSFCPKEDEVMAYKFFYEKGYTVSASYINPDKWQKGDLILFFDCRAGEFKFNSYGVYKLEYNNYSSALDPEVKQILAGSGIDYNMYSLAPVLEVSLLKEAGIWGSDEENYLMGKDFLKIKKLGEMTGLWDMFLDKHI